MTEDTVELSAESVDDALQTLEAAMQAGERTLSHADVRPSAHMTAHKARDAYRQLVDAHPDYTLTEGDS